MAHHDLLPPPHPAPRSTGIPGLADPGHARPAPPGPDHRPAPALLTTLTGRTIEDWTAECDTAPTGRLALLALIPVITAYEHALTDGEGRNTWRTDRYSPYPRDHTAATLASFLASLGYRLFGIEQAVADHAEWTGTTPLITVLGQPGDGETTETEPAGSPPGPDPATSPDTVTAHDSAGSDLSGPGPASTDPDPVAGGNPSGTMNPAA